MPAWALNLAIQAGEALLGGLVSAIPIFIQTHDWTATVTAFVTGSGLKSLSPQLLPKASDA
jgi:hypothetical protein